ncbi:putative HTH-type transcriptional regulator [Saliniradius amylolyticus]|uniref:Putative HTH-type transcriptional regulator n=1 Tax=Saliniradius amylolyticus TaxID=2183582 RepID=A0A2S2E608_9ALTE|nr:helix-turn-helix transcriptional regulator [Saliniradius amylolyticus]AWL13094.1 putative HTH-type transcriptional regulator [Saliniradius amylolyticus]
MVKGLTNRIRALRQVNGKMTQAELAKRAGVSRQTIISLEAGRYSPSLELAFRIAQVLQRPIDDVFEYRPDEPTL